MDEMMQIKDKVAEGQSLLCTAKKLKQNCGKEIPGSTKLENKIKAEIRFLSKIVEGKLPLKQSHLTSSNLCSLNAIVSVVQQIGLQHITSLLQPFKDEVRYKQAICVDVVAKSGHIWVKVIARNASALHSVWKGNGQFGDKSLVDVGKHYLSTASLHPVDFEVPTVVFRCVNGISAGLARELTGMGVIVDGDIVWSLQGHDSSDEDISLSERSIETSRLVDMIQNESKGISANGKSRTSIVTASSTSNLVTKVNLDVTTMLSLVSNLSNGHDQYTYGLPVLDKQAEQERQSKVLPRLQNFLRDKRLIACETAVDSFKTIMETIGGPSEKKRAKELLVKLTMIPDKPSQRTLDLISSAKLNDRAKMVFGTGDTERAITATANIGFVRAALQNGVQFSVFEHEARALTEAKEKNAKVIRE